MGRPATTPDLETYGGRLAARIRALREAAGLTVDQVQERMQRAGYPVSVATLYAWERGRFVVALDAVPALAKALKLASPAELFPRK